MAFRFGDSFDHYTTAQLARKYESSGGSNTPSISATAMRNGTAGLLLPSDSTGSFGGTQAFVLKVLDNQATWIVGLAVKMSWPSTSIPILVGLIDTATTQVDLRVNSAGQLLVTRNGTTLGTTSATIPQNVWNYIQLKATISSTAGTIEVRLNGTTVLSLTGQNTRATTNDYANRVRFGGLNIGNFNSVPQILIDDVYICDGSGSDNSDFLGDLKVIATYPDGAGSSTQWTANGAATNHEAVDESSPDDDSSYVASATAGDVDLYTFDDVEDGVLFATQSCILARKDDVGAVEIREKMRQDAVNYDGSTVNLGDNYLYYLHQRDTAPDGTAWTVAKFNAIEAGLERVS